MLADRFGFPHLKSSIEDHLIAIISIDNVFYFHSHAQVSSALDLQTKCERFMDQHAKDIIESICDSTTQRKPQNNHSPRHICCRRATNLYTVQKWLEHNTVNESNAMDLLECVRLSENMQLGLYYYIIYITSTL